LFNRNGTTTVATSRRISWALNAPKMHLWMGLCPRLCWQSLQCYTKSLAGLKGALFCGKEKKSGKGKKWGWEGGKVSK